MIVIFLPILSIAKISLPRWGSQYWSFWEGKEWGALLASFFVLGSLLYATGPVNIDHVSTKIADFLSSLYQNLLTIKINATKRSTTTAGAFFCNLQKQDTTFRTEDVSENITQSNF